MPMHTWALTAGEIILVNAKNKSYILLRNIDLTGIKSLTYEYSAEKRSGEIVVRIESLGGPVISKVDFTPTGGENNHQTLTSKIDKPISGRHHVYIIFQNQEKTMDDLCKLWTFSFNQLRFQTRSLFLILSKHENRTIQLFVPCLLVLLSCGSDDPSDNQRHQMKTVFCKNRSHLP